MSSVKNTEVFHTNNIKLHGEIRKVDIDINSWKTADGKDMETQSIILKIDDDDVERIELIDRDMSHKEGYYERGSVGTFTIRLDIQKEFGNKYTAQMNIISFEKDKKK